MRYIMLLWPHSNARYQVEAQKLARAELEIMLARLGVEYALEDGLPAVPSLGFRAPELTGRQRCVLARHSLLYALFERRDGDALTFLLGREEPRLGGDLSGILKYKGKTNELFTQLLVNLAWLAGAMPESVRLLDPMCGKGTTLFVALNRGWDVFGSDVDRAALREAESFFKRYLEYHRFKHATRRGSMTLRDKGSAAYVEFSLPQGALRLCEMDATRVSEAHARERVDLICADLPYGVQHGSAMPLEKLLRASLPGWRRALRAGGAIAVSFNAQTLPAARVRALFAEAGLRVLEGGAYDQLSHWVEQAVTRDVVVGARD